VGWGGVAAGIGRCPAVGRRGAVVTRAGARVHDSPSRRKAGRLRLSACVGAASRARFLQRLAARVPWPRLHLIGFHGVLTPNARLRPRVVPQGPEVTGPAIEVAAGASEAEPSPARAHRIGWARLLERVFDLDLRRFPSCGPGDGRARRGTWATRSPPAEARAPSRARAMGWRTGAAAGVALCAVSDIRLEHRIEAWIAIRGRSQPGRAFTQVRLKRRLRVVQPLCPCRLLPLRPAVGGRLKILSPRAPRKPLLRTST
jgi:hypothetical protein